MLEVRVGPLTGKQFPVPEGEPLTVGRTERATVAVPGDTRISGVHFAVEWDGKTARVIDRRSTNGTLLNGNPVSESTLREGDVITAGDTKFVVRFVADRPGSAKKGMERQQADASQPSAGSPAASAGSPAMRTAMANPSLNAPAVPSVPQVPNPSMPSAPSIPSMPSMPAIPGAAALGGAAAMAGVAMPGAGGGGQKLLLGLPFVPIPMGVHVPQIPIIPSLPGLPGVPAFVMPALPVMPAMPQIPGVSLPAMPAVPSLPGIPALPSVNLPQIPAIPALPTLPPIPVIPTFSAAQLAAMLAEMARRALKALWQPSLVVGGWKFMMIPKGWVVPEERNGINCAHKGVFPAHILAGEEQLAAGRTLADLRDAHALMMRTYMREPRVTENKPPAIPGAEKVLAVDVVYKLESGAAVLMRRLYAQNGQVAGTVTLMTLMDEFPKILADLQVVQSGLRFEPAQPVPPPGVSGMIGASA